MFFIIGSLVFEYENTQSYPIVVQLCEFYKSISRPPAIVIRANKRCAQLIRTTGVLPIQLQQVHVHYYKNLPPSYLRIVICKMYAAWPKLQSQGCKLWVVGPNGRASREEKS